MYETTKLSIHEATNMEWNIVTCKIVSCNAARTDAGHKSTITGSLYLGSSAIDTIQRAVNAIRGRTGLFKPAGNRRCNAGGL